MNLVKDRVDMTLMFLLFVVKLHSVEYFTLCDVKMPRNL